MSSDGVTAIDRAFAAAITFGEEATLLAEARRMDVAIAQGAERAGEAHAPGLVPAGELAPGDVVRLDDSCRRYVLRRRDAEWVFLDEVDGSGLASAHVDDLVERID